MPDVIDERMRRANGKVDAHTRHTRMVHGSLFAIRYGTRARHHRLGEDLAEEHFHVSH